MKRYLQSIAIVFLLVVSLPPGSQAAALSASPAADPPPVTDLAASAAGSNLTLSWTHAGAGVSYYEVHRSTAFYFSPDGSSLLASVAVGGSSRLQYVDIGALFPAAAFSYVVVPIGTTGARYPASNRAGVFVYELNPTWVHTEDRQAAQDFYLNQYLASENVPANWTGSHASCNAGTTSVEFKTAILNRINYFRAMAGVPNLRGLSATYNAKAQQAALMMSVNRALSHDPPATWICYTADGDQAAGSSNLYLGRYGPAAISGYITDPGSGNYAVGHRRWILFPPTLQMGSGDVPPANGYPSSNALWVFDTFSPRPLTREPYVAWPPPGYTPYQVVFARWSFSFPGADFTSATVTMQSEGAPVTLTQQTVVNGYGENTLVWAPAGASGDYWPKPAHDTLYTVTVQNVLIGGQSRSFTYNVIVFDPQGAAGAAAQAVFSSPDAAPGPAPRWPAEIRRFTVR